jgi:hypothetical protein
MREAPHVRRSMAAEKCSMISLCLLYLLRLYLPEGTGNGLLILKPLREAGIGDLTVSDLKLGLVMLLTLPAVDV